MSSSKLIWRKGKIFEISPFGTGFIEEESTGLAFGFDISMMGSTSPRAPNELEGRSVRFTVTEEGKLEQVHLATGLKLRKSPGREAATPLPKVNKSHGDSKIHKS
jgi:hypothetical protein